MQKAVADRQVSGAVTVVVTKDKIMHCEATGLADIARKQPMTPDSLFWIASMTKPVTAVALLMLQDEGKLNVADPVAKYIPEFASLKTPSGRIEIASATIAGFDYDDCPMHPAWIAPAEWLGSAEAKTWPIHLVTNQPRHRLHSQMDPGPVAQAAKVAGREAIHLNPTDAAVRGIADGDIVRVFNTRGACLAGAIIDDGVLPQVAVMATGAWMDLSDGEPERGGNPNVLTLDIGTSRLSQGSSALTALVEIERWTGADLPVRVLAEPLLAAG